MKQTLNLKLSQQLTLTPQLKQSLRLLQLSSLDLEQEIQDTLDTNPLLERIDNDQLPSTEAPQSAQIEDNRVPQPIAEAADPSIEIERTDTLAAEQDLSLNLQQSLETHRTAATGSQAFESAEFTQFLSKEETLSEHLNWQVRMTTLSDKDKLITKTLIQCLNEDGYLSTPLNEITSMFDPEMAIEDDEVAAMLSMVKTLDPIGAGARNLSERLSLLLQQMPAKSLGLEAAKLIVDQHLDLLAVRNFSKLRKALNLSEQALTDALAVITSLNPRIASQFQSDNENHITPDILVTKVGDTWVASLNAENQTKLRVNETYSDLLKSNIDQEGSDYIQRNLLEAKTFIKSLMSRYDTLLLVAQTIVKTQYAFFEHGAEHMEPMVLQDIANILEMHESTISRATSGKYLLSARGVVELKYFFSSALSNTSGAASSSTAIRSLIKKMVAAEPKRKPLSDSKIAKELEQLGHIVARRTVAKYRESMHIAPSSQRKSLV